MFLALQAGSQSVFSVSSSCILCSYGIPLSAFPVQIGGGSFQPTTLTSATKLALMVGKELNAKLMEKLQQEGQHSQIFNVFSLESESVDYFLLRLRSMLWFREVDCGYRTPSKRGGGGHNEMSFILADL
jgi:hypothetical protein